MPSRVPSPHLCILPRRENAVGAGLEARQRGGSGAVGRSTSNPSEIPVFEPFTESSAFRFSSATNDGGNPVCAIVCGFTPGWPITELTNSVLRAVAQPARAAADQVRLTGKGLTTCRFSLHTCFLKMPSTSTHPAITRRSLLKAGAPLLAPSSFFGQNSPSNRINVGMIGVGRQTVFVNLKQFLAMPDVQVVAVCDVDRWRLENAKKQVEDTYAKQSASGAYRGCRTFADYRELLADKTIDAVMISTPDHWHVPMSMDAMRAGKDVSCEKPLTRFITEGRALSDLATARKRVFRNDSEFRSLDYFHRAVELVRNGRIGKLHTIRSGVPGSDVGCPPQPDMPVPEGLDYERWQGPAPRAPYTEKRVHTPRSYDRGGWMRHTYYCDGMVTNWGAHLNDIAQWGNGTERTGPVEVEARGTFPAADSLWNVMLSFEAEYRYANGVRLFYKTDTPYVRFEGSDGWILAEYGKPLQAGPASILDSKIAEGGIHFPFKSDKQDFIDAVKSRGQTLQDAEVGHRTMSLCLLANIAVHVGGKLAWDPVKERFTNSPAANKFLDRPIITAKKA